MACPTESSEHGRLLNRQDTPWIWPLDSCMKKGHLIFMPASVIDYGNAAPPIFGKGRQKECHGIFFTRSNYSLMGSLETSDLFLDNVEMFN